MDRSMTNPFPGVNPYIECEHYWDDFHSQFLVSLRESLLDVLPAQYDAMINEQALLLTPDDKKLRKPDVAVTDRPDLPQQREPGGVATLPVPAPVVIEMLPLTMIEEKLVWVEIVNRDDRSLVTSIELLSPSNKDSRGRDDFRAKRNALLLAGVHLVDIDLLLAGERFEFRQALPPAHFYAFVARAHAKRHVEVYRWSLPDPLPKMPVPLRSPDPDVMIDLQVIYQTSFDRARYGRRLHYGASPAFLDKATRDWVEQVATKRASGSADSR
jgi:hypothetical protein